MAVVFVTGGSSGIGRATVRRLAGAGDQVFCGSRHPARAPLPPGVTPVTVDVADPESCRAAVSSVTAAAGRLDALVNVAGRGTIGPLEDTTDPEAHLIFEVNVFGPMRLAASALPVMRAQGGGRIVNVTSANDVAPAPFGGWYSASKAALASLSTVLDAEVRGFGVAVTVVAPGLYDTPMSQALPSFEAGPGSAYAAAFGKLRDRSIDRLPEAGDPVEVALAIEDCIRAADPPARVVVGADAIKMDGAIRRASAEDLARMLREFVAGLTP